MTARIVMATLLAALDGDRLVLALVGQSTAQRMRGRRQMNKRQFPLALAIFFAFTLTGTAFSAQEEAAPTLTVLNFANRHPGDQWDWLSKGLADMLITDLSASKRLQLVERERMQAFFSEMALAEKGLVDPQTAVQMGRMLKAQLALFGSFLVEGDELRIEAHIVEVASGNLRRIEWATGKAENVFRLEKQLAEQILRRLDMPLTDEERERLQRFSTLKVDAAAAYYRAFDSYDSGKYPDALGWFRLACRRDAQYLEARFRVGEMYYSLGEPHHALVEFRRVADSSEESPYSPVAAYLYAKIKDQRLGLPAAEDYMAVARRFPGTIPSALSAYRAGQLYQQARQREKAYEAYLTFDELMDTCAAKEVLRTAGSFRKDRVLKTHLYELRFARSRARDYYYAWLASEARVGRRPERVPPWALFFTKETTRYTDMDFSRSACINIDSRDSLSRGNGYLGPDGRFLLVASPGMEFGSVKVVLRPAANQPELTATGRAKRRAVPYADLSLSQPWRGRFASDAHRAAAEAFNLNGEDYFWTNRRLRVERPEEKVFQHNMPPGCAAVRLVIRLRCGLVFASFDVETTLRPFDPTAPSAGKEALAATLSPRAPTWQVHAASLHPEPAAGLVMAFADKHIGSGLLSATQHQSADLWLTRLIAQKAAFEPSRPFPFNASYDDYDPSLTRDPNGRWWLVFVSRRSLTTGSDLFISWSADGRRWEFPRKIQLDFSEEKVRLFERYKAITSGGDKAAKRAQERAARRFGPTRYYRYPQLLVDREGRFWTVFTIGNELYVTNSPDGVTWRPPVSLGVFPSAKQSISICQGRDGHLLVACYAMRRGLYPSPNPKRAERFYAAGEQAVFLADISSELTYPTSTFQKQTRPAFNFWAPDHKDLHVFAGRDGQTILVYRRFAQRKVMRKGVPHWQRLKDASIYVCTSRDLKNWQTYRLAARWPADFPRADWYNLLRPMAAALDGHRLVLALVGQSTTLPVDVRDLARELVPENLQQPVVDEQGNRLPGTAWVVIPEKDLVTRGLTYPEGAEAQE